MSTPGNLPLRGAVDLAALASQRDAEQRRNSAMATAPAGVVIDVTEASFAADVIEQSQTVPVIVDLWASWCGPCRLVAPRLGALKDKLGAQGLSVVGVTTDEPDVAATAVEKHGMKYSSVVDSKGDTSKAWGITNLPTMLVVDKKGVVRDVFVGWDSSLWNSEKGDSKIEELVKKLIAEK